MGTPVTLLFSLLVLCIPLLQFVEGDAVIRVTFRKYENPKGIGANGHCCDGKWGICQSNGCDHRFIICMGNYTSSNKTDKKHCPLGRFQSDRIENQNNNTFSRTIADLRNPLLFNVTGRLPDGIALKVDVLDYDGTSRADPVDLLIYRSGIKLNSKYVLNLVGTTKAKTRLYAEMEINCVNKTVGQRCESKAPKCAPPGRNDHYKCEKYTGKKICTDGYMGKNCELPPRGTPSGPSGPSGGRPSGPSRPNSFPGSVPSGPSGGNPSPGTFPGNRPSGGSSVPGIPSPGGGRPAPGGNIPSPSGPSGGGPALCPSPGPGDHFTCDTRTGIKTCTDGYTGTNCDRPPLSRFPSSNGGFPSMPSTSRFGNSRHATDLPARPDPGNPASRAYRPTFPSYIGQKADCDRIAELERDYRGVSGIYKIQPKDMRMPIPVYCIMTTDGRGWTQIQRREENGLARFNKNWAEYKEGFGEVGRHAEEWIGLENLYLLTKQRNYKLRIDMKFANDNGRWRYAEYSSFSVGSEAERYALRVSGYDRSSTAGDALQGDRSPKHNGMAFSTPDRDNDNDRGMNCAQNFQSGWWFNACFFSNLNGPSRTLGDCDKYGGKCISWIANGRKTVVAVRMAILPTD